MSNSIPPSQSPVTGWKGQRSPRMNGRLVWLAISGFSTQQCFIMKTGHSFCGWRKTVCLYSRARADRFPRIQMALRDFRKVFKAISWYTEAGPSGWVGTCCITVSTRWVTVNDKSWSTAVWFTDLCLFPHRMFCLTANWSENKGARGADARASGEGGQYGPSLSESKADVLFKTVRDVALSI